jgi:hypothetical protein
MISSVIFAIYDLAEFLAGTVPKSIPATKTEDDRNVEPVN